MPRPISHPRQRARLPATTTTGGGAVAVPAPGDLPPTAGSTNGTAEAEHERRRRRTTTIRQVDSQPRPHALNAHTRLHVHSFRRGRHFSAGISTFISISHHFVSRTQRSRQKRIFRRGRRGIGPTGARPSSSRRPTGPDRIGAASGRMETPTGDSKEHEDRLLKEEAYAAHASGGEAVCCFTLFHQFLIPSPYPLLIHYLLKSIR